MNVCAPASTVPEYTPFSTPAQRISYPDVLWQFASLSIQNTKKSHPDSDGTAWVDTDGDGTPDYTGPPPFSGDFEGGAVAGIWQTSSLATYPMTADSGSPISGAYSAMSTNQGVSNSASGTTISLTNMVNDTDTDNDGIADAASYSFAYSVSSESGWDFLVFCIDNDANCQRTSGYEMRWAGVLNGVYSGTVDAGAHTFTWNYWKDSSVSSNADTAWIDDVTMSVPCLLYTSPSPRDATLSRMPSSA